MAKYMVEAPHTKAECLQAVDEVLAEGSDFLSKFEWGCKAGVHTGWAIIEAESESAVQDMFPSSQHGKWRVTEVAKFTPEQVQAAHQQ